jgi:G3E family GTPase
MSAAADIVAGFLGSGKTTLLRHVLGAGVGGARVAVIVNEIGEIGIDGRVIAGLGAVERMVELSNGCVCCSLDQHRFGQAVQDLLDTVRPDVVLIEASGLAAPGPLAARVRGAGLRVDAVVTVVDAAHVERHLRETEVAAAQIGSADFLILNKTDVAGEAVTRRVERRLWRLNRRARIFPAVNAAVEPRLLLAPGVAAYRRAIADGGTNGAAAHLARDGIDVFVYRTRRRLREAAFARVVRRLPRAVYRAKGIVRFAEREWQWLFNYTCGRSDLDPVRVPGTGDESQVVVIGRGIERYRERVLAQLGRCEVDA